MQLKQAVQLSPQQVEDLLQGTPKPQSQAAQPPAEDSMDVDQQQEKPGSSATEVAASIMQGHKDFLSKLLNGPS